MSDARTTEIWEMDDFMQKFKKIVHIMLSLASCEVHTWKQSAAVLKYGLNEGPNIFPYGPNKFVNKA